MKLVEKYPILGSSVDPEKLSRTLKNFAGLIVALVALKGIDIPDTSVDTYVAAIVSVVTGVTTLYYGFLRLVSFARNKGWIK